MSKLTQAPTGMAAPDKPKSRALGAQIAVLGALVLVALLSAPALLLFVAGGLPTFAAWIGDTDERKTTAYTVGVMNVCGIIPFVIQVLPYGHSFIKAGHVIQDVYTWFFIYLAAGLGWIILSVLPEVIRWFIGFRLEQQRRQLEKRRDKLIDEWGEKVSSYNVNNLN